MMRRFNVIMTMMTMRMTIMCNENVKSRKIVIVLYKYEGTLGFQVKNTILDGCSIVDSYRHQTLLKQWE